MERHSVFMVFPRLCCLLELKSSVFVYHSYYCLVPCPILRQSHEFPFVDQESSSGNVLGDASARNLTHQIGFSLKLSLEVLEFSMCQVSHFRANASVKFIS